MGSLAVEFNGQSNYVQRPRGLGVDMLLSPSPLGPCPSAITALKAVSYSIVFEALAFDHFGRTSSARRRAADAVLLRRLGSPPGIAAGDLSNLATKCARKLLWARKQHSRAQLCNPTNHIMP